MLTYGEAVPADLLEHTSRGHILLHVVLDRLHGNSKFPLQ